MDTYTVTLCYDFGLGLGNYYYPIAIGIDEDRAEKLNKTLNYIIDTFDLWNDRDISGFYVAKISQKYCTNHKDFEQEPSTEVKKFFAESFFDLRTHLSIWLRKEI